MPTVTEILTPLLSEKCRTCGGKKEVKGAWLDFNLWDTNPCPDCRLNGKPTGLRFWRLVRECESCGYLLKCPTLFAEGEEPWGCQGLGYILKPEAELVGAGEEHLNTFGKWDYWYRPNNKVVRTHSYALYDVCPSASFEAETRLEALAAALVKVAG